MKMYDSIEFIFNISVDDDDEMKCISLIDTKRLFLDLGGK